MSDFETMAFIDKAELVAEQIKSMTLDQLIEIWNDEIADHYCRSLEIHRMNDSDWWGWLMNDLGAEDFITNLFESELNDWFFPNDSYFFYDSESGLFHSFNSKEDLLDSFINCFIDLLMDSDE